MKGIIQAHLKMWFYFDFLRKQTKTVFCPFFPLVTFEFVDFQTPKEE